MQKKSQVSKTSKPGTPESFYAAKKAEIYCSGLSVDDAAVLWL